MGRPLRAPWWFLPNHTGTNEAPSVTLKNETNAEPEFTSWGTWTPPSTHTRQCLGTQLPRLGNSHGEFRCKGDRSSSHCLLCVCLWEREREWPSYSRRMKLLQPWQVLNPKPVPPVHFKCSTCACVSVCAFVPVCVCVCSRGCAWENNGYRCIGRKDAESYGYISHFAKFILNKS